MFVGSLLRSTSHSAVGGALVATPFAETEFIGERERELPLEGNRFRLESKQPSQVVGRSNRMCRTKDGGLPHNPVSEPGGGAGISRNDSAESANRRKKASLNGRSVERRETQ